MGDFAPTIESWLAKATDEELEKARGFDHVRRDPTLAQRIRGEQQRRERKLADEHRRRNGYAG